MVMILELSNFQAWPKPGGLENQDQIFIDDVGRLLQVRSAVKEGRIDIGYYQPVPADVPKVKSPFGK